MSQATPQLAPVSCPACGAALALADRDQVTCYYCGAAVPVPADHREALRAAERAAAARGEAARLYRRLGVRPGRLLRLCAFTFGTWGRILGCFLLMAGAVLFAEVLALFAVGALIHNNIFETQSGGHLVDVLTLPLWVALMLGLTALAVFGRRVALARQTLQVALSAGPPAHAGGPATCRECGGPLEVGATDLGVRCLYCGADNLVALPADYLASFKGQVGRAEREIEQVVRGADAERRRRRRALLGHLALVAGLLGALLGVSIHIAENRAILEASRTHFSTTSAS